MDIILLIITHPLGGLPVTLLYAIMVVLWFGKANRAEHPWRELPLLLSPAFCYLILPILHRLFSADDMLRPRYPIAAYIPEPLFLLQIPLMLWAIWRMRGIRLVMILISIVHLWFSFIASFYAVMSITGRWL